jgi:hypothetical protein
MANLAVAPDTLFFGAVETKHQGKKNQERRSPAQ